MDKNIIIGKEVICYLDGGWQLTGVLKVFEEKKIVLENEGSLSVIFREKIVCMTVLHDQVSQNSADNSDGMSDSSSADDSDSGWPFSAHATKAPLGTGHNAKGIGRQRAPQEQGSRFAWAPGGMEEQVKPTPFPSNGISYEDSPMSIPSGILGATDVEEFSISFSDNNTRLEFGIEDDTSNESK